MDFIRFTHDKEPVGAVITYWDYNLSIAKLIRAQQYLKNPDCLFITPSDEQFTKVNGQIWFSMYKFLLYFFFIVENQLPYI